MDTNTTHKMEHRKVVELSQQVKELKHELEMRRLIEMRILIRETDTTHKTEHGKVVELSQQVIDLRHDLELERLIALVWEQRAKQAKWESANE